MHTPAGPPLNAHIQQCTFTYCKTSILGLMSYEISNYQPHANLPKMTICGFKYINNKPPKPGGWGLTKTCEITESMIPVKIFNYAAHELIRMMVYKSCLAYMQSVF